MTMQSPGPIFELGEPADESGVSVICLFSLVFLHLHHQHATLTRLETLGVILYLRGREG
jgi:hypothetical protein